ncbi:MAG: hypothetical protein JXK05_08215 [Campylobacterales bacterium]|nr:hypothetical protein [Campylobacterales bacterium]
MKTFALIAGTLLLSTAVAFAGAAGDVTIDGDTGTNSNIADGMSANAVQQVKTVNVIGKTSRVGDVTITGDNKGNSNVADGMNANAVQQVQTVNVTE